MLHLNIVQIMVKTTKKKLTSSKILANEKNPALKKTLVYQLRNFIRISSAALLLFDFFICRLAILIFVLKVTILFFG